MTKSNAKLKGVFTALATPFQDDGSIDLKSYEKLVASQLDAKVHGFSRLRVNW